MKEFLYKLFRLEWEPPICQTCEYLKTLLEQERRERNHLLSLLTNKPEVKEPEVVVNYENIKTRPLPWPAMRQRLEVQDRIKHENKVKEAQILKEKKDSLKELEKEVELDGTAAS